MALTHPYLRLHCSSSLRQHWLCPGYHHSSPKGGRHTKSSAGPRPQTLSLISPPRTLPAVESGARDPTMAPPQSSRRLLNPDHQPPTLTAAGRY